MIAIWSLWYVYFLIVYSGVAQPIGAEVNAPSHGGAVPSRYTTVCTENTLHTLTCQTTQVHLKVLISETGDESLVLFPTPYDFDIERALPHKVTFAVHTQMWLHGQG